MLKGLGIFAAIRSFFAKLIFRFSLVIKLIFISVIAGVGAAMVIIYFYSKDLPDYNQLRDYSPHLITRVYTSDGRLMEEYAYEKRVYAKYEDIPRVVIDAFVAAEDKNYFSHYGVDLSSIMRAVIINVTKKGRPVGGSTITQQVVKNMLLSREQTYTRKIKEAILAYRLSTSFSKEKVLEWYLNQIFLGHGSYGVASATRNYFNKDLQDITLEEAAVLASMPKAPSTMNPIVNYDRAKIRRNWVIGRMVEEGYVSEMAAKSAIKTEINLQRRTDMGTVSTDYYAEEVRKELIKLFGKEEIYQNGYVVFSNVDTRLQNTATKSLRQGLLAYDKKHGYRGPLANVDLDALSHWSDALKLMPVPKNLEDFKMAAVINVQDHIAVIGIGESEIGEISLENLKWARKKYGQDKLGPKVEAATEVLKRGDIIIVGAVGDGKYRLEQIPEANGGMIAIEPHTGKIVAMVGGYSFKESKFNRVTQAIRQPGSIFKPFIYLAALENGVYPNTIVQDQPVEMDQGAGLPYWQPKNYVHKFMGPITVRTALEKSSNLAAINLLVSIGIKAVAEVSERLGIYESPPMLYSMALGAYETTLFKIARAFNIILSDGIEVEPMLIDKIYDKAGNIVYRSNPMVRKVNVDTIVPYVDFVPRKRLISSDINYQLLYLMQGAVENGTSRRAKVLKRTLAGKTGTTNKSFDTMYAGMSPDLLVCVFIGHDQPKSLGKYENGALTAMPAFISFMKEAMKGVPDSQFPVPKSIMFTDIDRKTGNVPNEGTATEDIVKEAFSKRTLPSPSASSISEMAAKLGNSYEKDYSTEIGSDERLDSGFGGVY
jgi:penicillin-binding protein 1A